jgi:hypothetical protein
MRNPFRNKTMRGTYDAMVKAYHTKHRDVVRADGSECHGNGWASWFWRGYHGQTAGRWDRASKEMIGYACWCAGRDVRAQEAKN